MIVIDCSAAVEALRGHAEARELLASSTAFTPHLIDIELASAVRGLTLGRHITPEQGKLMIDAWPRLGVVRFAMHPLLGRVWQLRANLSAYDAVYVALAEELGCGLVTADSRIAAAPGARCKVTVLAA